MDERPKRKAAIQRLPNMFSGAYMRVRAENGLQVPFDDDPMEFSDALAGECAAKRNSISKITRRG